jgi:energy-coupling factor transport system permease protein
MSLADANPVAKLAVAFVIPLALLPTLDVVTAGTALLLELLALPWCGLPARSLARLVPLLLLAAGPIAVATALVGQDSGRLLVGLGPVSVTAGSLTAGAAIGLRVLAIALPGLILVASTDPTDLADALAQVARLPARFVLSALVAVRLLGVLVQEWEELRIARRARGLGGGPLSRITLAPGLLMALLVLAVRRVTVQSVAMEARGFGVLPRRTWARPSVFRRRDAAVVAGGILLGALATAAGLAAGTWHLVLI